VSRVSSCVCARVSLCAASIMMCAHAQASLAWEGEEEGLIDMAASGRGYPGGARRPRLKRQRRSR
jgi:hypothetical protein